MPELTPADTEKIRDAMLEEVASRPPTIGVVGVSGVGKSSTINTMFKTRLKISHTVAGTKEFGATDLSLHFTAGEVKGEMINLRMVDAPGLGEDKKLDSAYIQMYKDNLPLCDVILWVMNARNRAVALDQIYLEEFKEFGSRIVFGINQVDLVHPMDWHPASPIPSVNMEKHIEEIVKDRSEKIQSVLNAPVKIIAYSAEKGYNLEQLFALLIDSIPSQRKWLFASLKNFSFRDFVPVELASVVDSQSGKGKRKDAFSLLSRLFNQD